MRLRLLLLVTLCACLVAACDSPLDGNSEAAAPQKPVMRLEVITPEALTVSISGTVGVTATVQAVAALPPTAPPPPKLSPPTPTMAPPPTIARDLKEVQKQLAQVKTDAGKMRGLKPKANVPAHFISGDEMRYMMAQRTHKYYTPEKARLDAIELWLLLMIDDRETDFLQMEIDFAGEAILGLYDHETKEFFVRADGPTLSPGSRETLAHEFVHSLQDQHHNLQKLLPDDLDHDQSMAIRSLVEGDATVSGILYASEYMTQRDFAQMYEESSGGAPPVPGRAPVYLQQGWQFPYVYGSRFVLSLAEPGNFKPIDKAFASPPRSTEQIMHPHKYLDTPRDEPLPVKLPPLKDVLGAGWNALRTDTLGEFDLYVMLLENYQQSPEAAAGWGGALYTMYSDGKDYVTVMGSRWDTPKDADQWEFALTQSFKLFNKKDGLWMDRGRAWGMKRSGDQIMFVSGTSTDAVQKAMGAIKP